MADTQAVTTQDQMKGLSSWLDSGKVRAAMQAVLPKHLTAEKVVRVALGAVARNPQLLQCSRESIYSALMQSSSLGLEVDYLGHAYLVPYWNNKERRLEAQLIPGYKGLIRLARQSGEVEDIEAALVYSNEPFQYVRGTTTKLEHEPKFTDRGEPLLVYAIATLKGGHKHVEAMGLDEVDKIRDRSLAKMKNPGMSPWSTDYEEMAKKTAVRRLVKYLPLSSETSEGLSKAIELSDAIEADFTPVVSPDVTLPGTATPGEPEAEQAAGGEATRTESLTEQVKATLEKGKK